MSGTSIAGTQRGQPPTAPAPDGDSDGPQAEGGSGCGAVHAFCDDFDNEKVGSVPMWSGASVASPSTLTVLGFDGAVTPRNVLDVARPERRKSDRARRHLAGDATA